jgi:hypothetical protein
VAVDGNRVYVANSSPGLQVIEFFGGGVEEARNEMLGVASTGPSIVQGVLCLPAASSCKPQPASLHDISGRKALDLRVGANDVSALAPGVYFVRQASSVRKVVFQH